MEKLTDPNALADVSRVDKVLFADTRSESFQITGNTITSLVPNLRLNQMNAQMDPATGTILHLTIWLIMINCIFRIRIKSAIL